MNIKVCSIRKINSVLAEFEAAFAQAHQLTLNEAMLMCTLSQNCCSSGTLADCLGLSNSNTSKVIRSVERKGYIIRRLGDEDKRQMFFVLTESGELKLKQIKESDMPLSPLLERLLDCVEQ